MPRSCVHQRNRFGQSALWGLAVAAVAGFVCLPAVASAQGKKKAAAESEKKTGKITEVDKKGKTCTLKVAEADGENFDVLVNNKVKFLVNGKGDAAFLKHLKTFVSSEKVITANNQYFGKQFTVHLGNAPDAVLEPVPDNPEVFRIAGPIVDCDESSFTINVEGAPCKVSFEQGAVVDVTVESTDPEHAAVGSEVEVEGTTTKGGKFHATGVVVTLDKPLVASEVFAHDKKAAKTKSPSTKMAKKPSKTDRGDKGEKGDTADKGDETPAADPLSPSSDPFNVLNDKKNSKKKTGVSKPKPKKSSGDGDTDS